MNLIVAKTRKNDVSNTNGVFAAAREFLHCPSRHFATTQHLGRFRSEADINWQARPAVSVANDPIRTFGAAMKCVERAYLVARRTGRDLGK